MSVVSLLCWNQNHSAGRSDGRRTLPACRLARFDALLTLNSYVYVFAPRRWQQRWTARPKRRCWLAPVGRSSLGRVQGFILMG